MDYSTSTRKNQGFFLEVLVFPIVTRSRRWIILGSGEVCLQAFSDVGTESEDGFRGETPGEVGMPQVAPFRERGLKCRIYHELIGTNH